MSYKLAEELHKPLIKKFKRRKLYARFKNTFLESLALNPLGILPRLN